jgi:glycosyltransferase involved in cell wall biosynthesis
MKPEERLKINWLTGGSISKGWAYENNAHRLSDELSDFIHVFDDNRLTDVAVYFDILIHKKTGNLGKINILRLGGHRPLEHLYKNNINQLKKDLSPFDAIIALNQQLFRIAKSANKNSYLVPNGLDLEKWPYLYNVNTNKKFIVGFAGNVSNEKAKKLKGFEYVENVCHSMGVMLKCYLKNNNEISHNKMLEEFYGKIDCLLYPTIKEGSSNVIMEALATGVPVITTRNAGFHGSYLENEKNVLFCTRNLNDIEKKLVRLKYDLTLRDHLSKNGRKFCEKHHDIKNIAKMYRNIIYKCKK